MLEVCEEAHRGPISELGGKGKVLGEAVPVGFEVRSCTFIEPNTELEA